MRRTIAALALLAVLVGACGAQTVPASVGSVAPGASVAVTQAPDATSVGSVAPGASVAVTQAPDATPDATTAPACVAGLVDPNGVSARTFCGPATANLTLGEKTYNLAGGECQDLKGAFTMNIGTIELGKPSASPPHYFGVVVNKAGAGVVVFVVEGTGYASERDTVVTLDPGTRLGGTFEGLTFDSGIKISGTFNCI